MTETIKYWFLQDFDFVKKLGMSATMRLSKELEMEYLRQGSEVTNGEEREIVFLKKGRVKIVDRSTERTKYLVKSHNIFGQYAWDDLPKEAAGTEYAIALEDVVICRIPTERMHDLMEEHSALKNSVIKFQHLQFKRLENRLSDLLYKDSKQRITEFIRSHVQEYGTEQNGVLEVKNVLSHKDIAHLTNTSRQTVNNVLTQLRKDKVLDYSRKHIRYFKAPTNTPTS